MKHIRILFSLFFACLLGLPSAFSQDISTQGTEFWVSFMGNGFKTRYDTWSGLPDFTWLRIQLIVSAKRDCNCTITNPNTNYQQSFHVNANSTYLFDDIPWDEAYMELEEHGQILNKGLCITADDTVSVYCANIAEVSFDASYILPTPALGNEYIVQTYNQSSSSNSFYGNYYTSAFLIVATEDGETTVHITPSVNTLDGHTAYNEYSITLRKGEAYQVRSHNNYSGSRDLSGTLVTTAPDCKKFALFNGNNLTMVPDGGNDSDCIFEQAMPLTAWGKKFVVTASLGRQLNDIVKITSAHDNNEIRRNGVVLTTLNTGESTTFELRQSDKSCFIEATQSCAVYLYNHSKDDDSWFEEGTGAPSMVWIAPIEQRINEITFSTFNYVSEHDTDIDDHYVNIIVNADDIQHVYLDNELLSNFEPVNGTSEYYFLRKQIDHGAHHLSCINGFNAHVYGFGHAKGYAYLVGSKATDLSTTIFINGETVQQLDTISSCSLESFTFGAQINYQNFEVEWDFGDGTPHSHNIIDSHTYNDYGLYEVTLTVTSEETPCQASSSITQTIYIDLYHVADSTIHASTCYNGPSTYTENGFNIPYDEPGTYEGSKSIPTSHGCDSIVHLILEVGDVFHAEPDIVRICYDNDHPASYTWINGMTYHDDAHIIDTLPNGDCYGIFILDLSFVNNETQVLYVPQHEDEIVCDTYDWEINGQTYHFETSGDYSHFDDLSPFDCVRETQLHLNISYTPHPYINSDNPNPHWPITATEFNVNRYTYYVKDDISDISKWKIDQCKWDISKDSWRVVPDENDPLKCKVYAMDWTADSICLSFKAVNACSGEEGVIAEYWLHPSFYGINDAETTLSDFNVVPNPNHGEMDLYFENLTGKVSVNIYDMHGILVDNLETYNELSSKTLHYTLEHNASGVFFFVANAKEGTIAKKVIIK